MIAARLPTAPPTCWQALTRAEATPASAGCTPSVAAFMAVENMRPRPTPMSSMPGRTGHRYVVPAPIRVKIAIPPPAISIPSETRSFAETRVSSSVETLVAVIMISAVIGRNATPVSTGLYPSLFLQVVREEEEHSRTSRHLR